jgi:hemolysin type calcium-binding protein
MFRGKMQYTSGIAAALTAAVALAVAPAAQAGQINPPKAQFAKCHGQAPTITGTAGDDTIQGTPGNDVISGLGGADKITGGGGDDVICGGGGADELRGGPGADVLDGGSGDDTLYSQGQATAPRTTDAPGQLLGGLGVDECHGAVRQQCERDIVRTQFDREKHAFHFVNYFTYPLKAHLPVVGDVNFGAVPYGLCGGMTYAAADTFNFGGMAPSDTQPPAYKSDLQKALLDRQLDSLTADNAKTLRTFLDWQLTPLDDKKIAGHTLIVGLTTRTRRQLNDKILPRLRDGKVVPLGMVKVDGTQPPWHNHQVLAIGSFVREDTGEKVVKLYDPNFVAGTNDDDGITYLQMDQRRQTHDADGLDRVESHRWRGVFTTPYSAKRPYWVPASSTPGSHRFPQ